MLEEQEDKNKHIRLREWSCGQKRMTKNKYPQKILKTQNKEEFINM